MSKKVLLLFLVVAQILVLQAMALDDSQPPLPGIKPLVPETTTETQNEQNKAYESTTTESSSEGESTAVALAPDIRRLGKHHSTDKSVAGGGVILGGLVTATFAAVFCYIRVTRKRDTDGY